MGNWKIEVSTPKKKDDDIQKTMRAFFGESVDFMSMEELNERMGEFVHWYNNVRKQPDTGKTPAQMSKECYGTESPPLPDKIMIGNEEFFVCEAVYNLTDPHKVKKLLKSCKPIRFIEIDEIGLHFAIRVRKIDSGVHIKGGKLILGSSVKSTFAKHRDLVENLLGDCIKGEPIIKIESGVDAMKSHNCELPKNKTW